MKRFGTFLITVALIAGTVGCAQPPQYNLTIFTTEGGEITTPGEETSSYDEGAVVPLVAFPHTGYRFVNWTGDVGTVADVEDASTTIIMDATKSVTANFAPLRCNLIVDSTDGGSVSSPGEGTSTYDYGTVVDLVGTPDSGYQFVNWTGNVGTVADVNTGSTTVTMNSDYIITASFAKEICDWYDLDAIRHNLGGSYVLMNDLDSTTLGYGELASPTANGGKGWEPIGRLSVDPNFAVVDSVPFTGILDGRGHDIGDLFAGRADEDGVALFGCVGGEGVVENLGMMNAALAGRSHVGGLVGRQHSGNVRNSRFTGTVSGSWSVGGLVGNNGGTVNNSYSTGSVTGDGNVGGLVGSNHGAVSDSYSSGYVTGGSAVGGLVGWQHHGNVSNSHFAGTVTGERSVGGLVGEMRQCTVSNSYYSYEEVFINGRNTITVGALSDEDFGQWLANDKFLDVNERLTQEDGYYLINDVNDFKSLLAFGQDGALKFRLRNDLDLGNEPDFCIPYLAGEFDGNGHGIANLRFSFDFISQVGLFGYLAAGGAVNGVSAENVNITADGAVGGLVGENDGGTVSNSYSTGMVAGYWSVGGLVGRIGWNGGTVSNSHYSYDDVLINDKHVITIGALPNEEFQEWLANDRFLNVNERLSRVGVYYVINDVGDFKQLLAFGQDGSLKFRLTSDLDLAAESDFYIPYLAGEFDGNGHRIWNLSCHFDSVGQVGLFGYLGSGGQISEVGVENVDVTVTGLGDQQVGGLAGGSSGTVSNSYSTGSVTGYCVGGLVGWNKGTVSNSYSTVRVAGYWSAGGLVGWHPGGTVRNSYSTGSVAGSNAVGGLLGMMGGIVSGSFWDIETSGQAISTSGTGKTTTEMKSIATFSGAGWNIIAVANPSTRNPSYIWNIVSGQTYPFLNWQSVS